GTWFAVNGAGVVVALTNRRGAGAHDPARRSRGILVLEAARSRSYSAALAHITRVDPRLYNPFICFVADAEAASAVHAGIDGIAVAAIDDGAHAITNWALDANEPAKAKHALETARCVDFDPTDDAGMIAHRLHAALASHGESL